MKKGEGDVCLTGTAKTNAEQRQNARQRRGTGDKQGRQVLSCSSTEHQPAIQGRTRRLCGRQWTMKQTRGRGRKRQIGLWMGRRRGGEEAQPVQVQVQTVWRLATVVVKAVLRGYFLGRTGQFRSRKTLQMEPCSAGAAGWAAGSSARRIAAAFITAVLSLGS